MGKHKKYHKRIGRRNYQKTRKAYRNEWWDEECKEAISKKNIARKKCLQNRTRANQEQYAQARKTANKTCKKKMKQQLNNRIK